MTNHIHSSDYASLTSTLDGQTSKHGKHPSPQDYNNLMGEYWIQQIVTTTLNTPPNIGEPLAPPPIGDVWVLLPVWCRMTSGGIYPWGGGGGGGARGSPMFGGVSRVGVTICWIQYSPMRLL